jgi:hypothetical protein
MTSHITTPCLPQSDADAASPSLSRLTSSNDQIASLRTSCSARSTSSVVLNLLLSARMKFLILLREPAELSGKRIANCHRPL